MQVGKKALSFLLSLVMLVSIALSPADVFADQPYFLGVDVSEHNSDVDFKALKKKGYDFAMIRVGYVTRKGEFIDKLFYEHIKGACEAGMFFGLYLYSYACDSDRVKQEANFTINTIKTIDSEYLKNMTLPVAYDVEDSTISAECTKKQITDHTLQYCSAIKKAGYTPMVYANLNWFNHYIDINQITSNNIKIWYANWVSNPDFSTVKTVGTTGIESDMWQYQSGSYANDGINLDKNVLYPTIDFAEITLSKTAYTYSGSARKPSVTVKMGSKTLKQDTDYTVAYSNNINAGTATVTIKGKGDYKGSVKKKFTIKAKSVESDAKLTLEKSSYVYDGTAKKPAVTVKDAAGKTIEKSNYSVAYSNNKNVGVADVKVTFKENYTGSVSEVFKIKPKGTSVSSLSAKFKGFTVKWNKQATQTTGYQIQYSTDKNFSKNNKTVTVSSNSTTSKTITDLTAKKKYYVRIRTYKLVDGTKYCSSWSSSKNITTLSYPNSISLSATSYTYNGKVKKPTVTIKDNGKAVSSKYYTVSYQSGRKNVGTYTVTIKFKAPYSGTVKKTFTIKPKATTLSSVTAKSKGFTAKWKKQATQTTGYQIQYSTSSKFSSAKTVTVSKNSTTSKAVSKLSAKKKYYVRVRTYKTVKVNGKSTKIYSAWSSYKAVTTKK